MAGKPPKTPNLPSTRAVDRRSLLAAAPAAGLAAGAAAFVGREGEAPPGADPHCHLDYSETPHIRAYYHRARF